MQNRLLVGDESFVFSMKRKIIATCFVAIASVLSSALIYQDTHAANRGALNAAESEARGLCISQSRGAIWFSNDASNFYAMGVTASASDTSVTVYLRGSSNTCVDSTNAGKSSYAIHISSSGRLSGISPTASLFRGTWPSAHQSYNWTSQGNSVGATLDITGVASGSTVWVSLYRCPSFNGINIADNGRAGENHDVCYASDVPIQVYRLPAIANWSIGGFSTVSSSTATPGSTVTFKHYLDNTGSGATDKDIYAEIVGQDNSAPTYLHRGGYSTGTYNGSQLKEVDARNFTIPSSATAGQKFCQRVGWWPKSSTDNGYGAGGFACVTVAYDYTITPLINSATNVVAPGTTISVSSWANNVGTRTNNTSWSIHAFRLPVGVSSIGGERYDNVADICVDVFAGLGAIGCTLLSSNTSAGESTFVLTPGESRLIKTINNISIPATALPGEQYCYVFSIDPYTQAPSLNKRHSVPFCVLVANSPYLSIIGGDAWAGNDDSTKLVGFQGSTTSGFGSFGEYGLFATGDIFKFGSAGKVGANPLTFANKPPLSGRFSPTHQVYSPLSKYDSTPTGTPPANLFAASGVYEVTSPLTIGSGGPVTVTSGAKVVIYAPDTTVTIANSIQYGVGGTSFKDQASLTIIAKEIRIMGATKRIDGYLYARNLLKTCEEGPDGASAATASQSAAITSTGACSQQLVINGAVTLESATSKAIFNRSFGGTKADEPAEMIRMRPEVFLTPYEVDYATGSSSYRTVSELELPPRY